MKKALLAIVLALAAPGMVNAQKLYVKGGLGYAFTHGGQTLDNNARPYAGDVNIVISNTNSVTEKYSLKKVSFASGAQAVLALGYMFNANIGVELGASVIFAPRKFERTHSETDPLTTYKENLERQASLPVILTPSLVMQLPAGKVTGYARAGVAVSVGNKIIDKMVTEEDFDPEPNTPAIKRETTFEITTRTGIGFTAAMGAKYNLTNNLQLWAEASLLSLTLYAKEESITEYKVNGVNSLSFLTPDQKKHVFELEDNSGDPSSNLYPSYSLPFSNIAVNVGVAFSF